MTQISEDKLIRAISEDDIDAFSAMADSQCGKIRLGRFPVLSLLYLYDARKILGVYEEDFIKISEWERCAEPVSISKRFSKKAGKCLRLYHDTVVTPLEMLLIIDDTKRLKNVYPLFKPTDTVKSRLKKIYFVKYSLGIEFNGDEIVIERRPLKRKEKRKIVLTACGGALAAAAAIATPIAVVSYVNAHKGDVTELSQIDFSSKQTYTLKSDITVPANFSADRLNCTIIGDGHKITFGENASFGELNGKMSGLVMETTGNPVFTVCTEKSSLTDISVIVNANIETSESSAFVALTNYGSFEGVTVTATGSVAVNATEANEGQDIVIGGIVMVNAYYSDYLMTQVYYGKIKNCSVSYSSFSLKGEPTVNAVFAGVVGFNNGLVTDCTAKGEITADTLDLAGICYENNSTLSRSVNQADLTQTTDSEDWIPTIGGIAMYNHSVVDRCISRGNIATVGPKLTVCGGIAAYTYGENNYCLWNGDISVTAESAYVGGIYGVSQVATNGFYVYFGFANHCLSTGKIFASLGDGKSCVGGVGGLVLEADLNGDYFGGGVTDCIFMGEIQGNFDYFGNIVGVCGKHVYEANSYKSGDSDYANFDGNYYIENGRNSFGATASTKEEIDGYAPVEGQGKGTTPLTESEIKGSDLYNAITEVIGK